MVQRRVTIVLALAIASAIVFALISSGSQLAEHNVLVVELSGDVPDSPVVGLSAQLGRTPISLPTLQLQLDKAAVDDRIDGMLLHIRGLSIGSGRRRELHDMIAGFRESGKRVVALLDIGRISASAEAYVASAASEVYVVPGFMGPLTGIAGEFMLFGGLLEQLGIRMEYARIGAYKSATEAYAGTEFSAPAREMYEQLMDGLFDDFVSVLAEGRKLAPEQLREVLGSGPTTGPEWVDAGLADGISGREDVLETAGFGEAEELTLDRYANVSPQSLGLRGGARIALVFGEGAIVPGSGGSSFGADRISEAIESATEDESIRAIVLRINSPGGSPLASDQIWRAVKQAREKKPVVVSMSDAAASGGYYVASAATSIVAQPTTQTGSIGVYILRPSLGGLFAKLGVNAEVIQRGELSGLGAASRALSDEQKALLERIVKHTYDDFLSRVSEGRKLEVEQVDRVGQGRVWLGSKALELSLVDRLGGLETAIELAKQESGIAADEDPERVLLPKAPPLREQIRQLLGAELLAPPWSAAWLAELPAEWRGVEQIPPGIVQLSPYWFQLR